MATKDKTKVADFATLAEKLLELEQDEFGGPAHGDAATWRKRIIRAVGAARVHRERLGMLLVHGRQHFKKDRVWLRVKESVAKAAGYKSRRSIETLMDDASRARGLKNASADRYRALERCGVDAAETRWADLIDKLREDIPENESAEDARRKVEEVYQEFMDSKDSKEVPVGSKIERLNVKIERLVVQLFGQLPKDQREAAIQKIIAEATQKADDVAMQKSAAASTQTQNPANSQPVLVVARADKDRTAMIGLPNSTGTRFPVLGGAHPWGDAFLGSLVPGPRGLEPQGYDDKALHRAYGDKLPKRFFVGDIFASGLSDFIASHHIEFFQRADRHTYLVLTTNVRRMLGICNRADALKLPGNLWIGVSVTSGSAFDQIEALAALKTPNKFVSLLPFKSGNPIREFSPTLEEILKTAGIRWVVFGGDQVHGWDISENDEDEVARASHAAGCPVYCTSAQTMENLIRFGRVDVASVPGIFSNSAWRRNTWKLRELPDFTHASLSLSA